jgi:hypothetical protein
MCLLYKESQRMLVWDRVIHCIIDHSGYLVLTNHPTYLRIGTQRLLDVGASQTTINVTLSLNQIETTKRYVKDEN